MAGPADFGAGRTIPSEMQARMAAHELHAVDVQSQTRCDTNGVRSIMERARHAGADTVLCPPDRACAGCQALMRTLEVAVPELQAAAVAFAHVRLLDRLEGLLRRVEQGIEAADRQRDWRARADGLAARIALVEALHELRTDAPSPGRDGSSRSVTG